MIRLGRPRWRRPDWRRQIPPPSATQNRRQRIKRRAPPARPAGQALAMADQHRQTDQPPAIDDQPAEKSQQQMRRQQTTERGKRHHAHGRGARHAGWEPTDDSSRLAAPGSKPSRATLNNSRAPIMMVAMMALKMASATPALSACAAQGPIASDTKVAKGAGLASTAGNRARRSPPRSPTRPWRSRRSSRRR